MHPIQALPILLSTLLPGDVCEGELRALRPPLPLPLEAPQGIAVDESDGSLWIVSAISSTVLHLGNDLAVAGGFEAPPGGPGTEQVTGIAYRPGADTLLLARPSLNEIWEVEKDGAPTGLIVPLAQIERPVNIIPEPFIKGLAFDPEGDEGQGSLWVVEAILTAVYEVSLQGRVLRSFCHPDDPDGCPGLGAAAKANDVGLLYRGGEVAGLELVGGRERADRLLRVDLDGKFLGVAFPLAAIGGRPGGFARTRWEDPATGASRDVLLVTVESAAELHVLESVEPDVLPIRDLSCEPSGASVRLSWEGYEAYERVEILREGERIGTLSGTETSYVDEAPPEGLLEYRVLASSGGCEYGLECSVLLGVGQVLRSEPLGVRWAIDIAEDGDENLWISDLENRIHVWDKDLRYLNTFPSPFGGEDDATTAIAYNPTGDTLFVYNGATNRVAEIDAGGSLVSDPFPSGVPSTPEEPALVASMLYDPGGDGGGGSFWLLELETGTLQERARSGDLLGSCLHPDYADEPPPAGSDYRPFYGGISAPAGGDLDRIALVGGRIREQRVSRILRVDPRSCEPSGGEIPVEGIARLGVPRYLGMLESTHEGRHVAYVVFPRFPEALLLEVDLEDPAVPRPGSLRCGQPLDARAVELTFRNPGGLDRVEILRDGALIADLPGGVSSYLDPEAPEGLREYAVRGRRDGAAGGAVSCTLRVGAGSIAARAFAHPGSVLHQVSPDPVSGGYVAASINNRVSGELFRFTADLRFAGTLPSPFGLPEQVAALAVRDAGGESEIWCVGWNPGAPPAGEASFPMSVVDASGRVTRQLSVRPPAPRGRFVTFPSGLAWDRATDTFWLLERNADTVMNFGLDGEAIGFFRHPAPIHQDGVIDYGIAVAAERNTLYLAAAGPRDHEITKILEVTRFGTLTGVEIPIGRPDYESSRGFALDGDSRELVVSSFAGSVQDLVRYRAFDPVPPVEGLSCAREGAVTHLEWVNGGNYDSLSVFRDGAEAATVAGSETSWVDVEPGRGPGLYRVVATRGVLSSPGVICGPANSRPFLRGDAEENGVINISDAISILGYLFLGGEAPACLKAADANDSGSIDISDGIALLGHLFLSGPPPAEPFPYAALDPTEDDLDCPVR